MIFTSGSTGDPKGVVLSHRNILSNVHQIEQQVHLLPDEVVLGILPFFHSFGFTVTIWTVLCLGKKVVYHFNPLDARMIGKLCEKHGVTLIAGTPTFMRFYLKRCEPRAVRDAHPPAPRGREAQARAVPRDPRDAGHRADGGYGMHRALAGRRGERARRGRPCPTAGRSTATGRGRSGCPCRARRSRRSIPRPAPTCPPGAEGMICVKGPQVMVGYLNRPEATAKVLKDGWYTTGDLGYVDADGFLKITDRLSRFSKIGGEMVPHVGVESAIMEVAGVDEQHVAVTALPDPKRGERLCVLYTDLGMPPDEVHKALMAGRAPQALDPLGPGFRPGRRDPDHWDRARSTSGGFASWPRRSGSAEPGRRPASCRGRARTRGSGGRGPSTGVRDPIRLAGFIHGAIALTGCGIPVGERRRMEVVLRVTSGPHAGQEYLIDQSGTFVVGRSSRVAFPMPEDLPALARAFPDRDQPPVCHLIDLGSTNGTKVNGLRVERVLLRDGDVDRGRGQRVLRPLLEARGMSGHGGRCAGCGCGCDAGVR